MLTNTKRMDMVHDLLKKEKSKSKVRRCKSLRMSKTPLKNLRQSSEEDLNTVATDPMDWPRSSSFSVSSTVSNRTPVNEVNFWKDHAMDPQDVDLLQANWRSLQQAKVVEQLGQRLVYKMMEIEPSAQWLLRVEDANGGDAQRVAEVGQHICQALEFCLFALGPDCSVLQDLLPTVLKLRHQDGVSCDLLADALPICIERALPEGWASTAKDEIAWRQTFVPLLRALDKAALA